MQRDDRCRPSSGPIPPAAPAVIATYPRLTNCDIRPARLVNCDRLLLLLWIYLFIYLFVWIDE